MKDILEITELEISFYNSTENKYTPVATVDKLSIKVGEIIGIVGESGSGKSVICKSILGLLPKGKITGNMTINNKIIDLSNLKKISDLRGNTISMICQDPMSALDPLMSVRKHLLQRLKYYKKNTDQNQCLEILEKVGITNPENIINSYPHQLSGGLNQRVAIALALIGEPKFLIADEPTTALDVITQSKILNLLHELSNNYNVGIIFISHDLAVVSQICSRVIILEKGRIVEKGIPENLFTNPQKKYTKDLINALPPTTRFSLGVQL